MRILLANDDGIDAFGLALLKEAASLISKDVWVVAPSGKRTAASNSLTIGRPLEVTQVGSKTFACSGTPADCITVAMTWLFQQDQVPDLVLSGVNDGRNVAEDIAYSGTMAIAREATFWGIPAVALSRVKNADYERDDATHIARMIDRLWTYRKDWLAEGHWLSVNLPTGLPADLHPATIGRDKIGSSCEILRQEGDLTEIMVPRGRQGTKRTGDENSLLSQGFATFNRLHWASDAPVSHDVFQRLSG